MERGDHLCWECQPTVRRGRSPRKRGSVEVREEGHPSRGNPGRMHDGSQGPGHWRAYAKKQWRIVTSSKELKHKLWIRCDKSHSHVECIGHGRPSPAPGILSTPDMLDDSCRRNRFWPQSCARRTGRRPKHLCIVYMYEPGILRTSCSRTSFEPKVPTTR